MKFLLQQVYENISKYYEILACEQLIFHFILFSQPLRPFGFSDASRPKM